MFDPVHGAKDWVSTRSISKIPKWLRTGDQNSFIGNERRTRVVEALDLARGDVGGEALAGDIDGVVQSGPEVWVGGIYVSNLQYLVIYLFVRGKAGVRAS